MKFVFYKHKKMDPRQLTKPYTPREFFHWIFNRHDNPSKYDYTFMRNRYCEIMEYSTVAEYQHGQLSKQSTIFESKPIIPVDIKSNKSMIQEKNLLDRKFDMENYSPESRVFDSRPTEERLSKPIQLGKSIDYTCPLVFYVEEFGDIYNKLKSAETNQYNIKYKLIYRFGGSKEEPRVIEDKNRLWFDSPENNKEYGFTVKIIPRIFALITEFDDKPVVTN